MSSYSFLDNSATWTGPGGTISLGGTSGAAKEGITIEQEEDIGHMDIGAGGAGQHSLHAGKSGTITIRVLKTSAVNQKISNKIAFQRASAANYGQDTFSIANLVTGDIITCQQVAPKKFSPITFAEDAGINEWALNAVIIDFTLGGDN